MAGIVDVYIDVIQVFFALMYDVKFSVSYECFETVVPSWQCVVTRKGSSSNDLPSNRLH